MSNRFVDLRETDSPVEDQYYLGSCSANAVANAYEQLLKQHGAWVNLSRLFIYYNSRVIEGTVNEDGGAFLHDALNGLQEFGVCTEDMWPYDLNSVYVKPTYECYQDAQARKIKSYSKIENLNQILEALDNKSPVVFGILINNEFDNVMASNPVLHMTGKEDKGHAMCLVGYDLDRKLFLAKNSFGKQWGDQGYCWIPFNYMEESGYDIWTFSLP